jgi:putative FmdB family regulatory protein
MPLYEYSCPNCNAAFERRRAVAERSAPQPCPECGDERVVLRMSMPAMVGTRASESIGYCPGTGAPCGCANAIRN